MIYTLTLNPALDREMTVPSLVFDQVLRASSIRTDYGGKGFNVSRALLALGAESSALGFIGGAVGDQLSVGLRGLGIRTDFVHIHGETRINISVVADDHRHYFKVNEAGPVVSEREAALLLDKINSLLRKNDWLILAGSAPPGIQPSYIAEIFHLARTAGAYTALDMEGAFLQTGCASGVFLVKPNQIEASQLTGMKITSLHEGIYALEPIHKMGATLVVISMGRLGAIYSDGKNCWLAQAPSIVERNPIGAGDAMLAGLVWGIQTGLAGSDVLRWGIACGTATASLDGTAVASYSMVKSLLEEVNIREENIRFHTLRR